jgi:hypothetical protein
MSWHYFRNFSDEDLKNLFRLPADTKASPPPNGQQRASRCAAIRRRLLNSPSGPEQMIAHSGTRFYLGFQDFFKLF